MVRYLRVAGEVLWFFARWIGIFPVLGIVTALLIGVVSFDVAAGLGLPDLFWRLDTPRMVLVGMSLSILFALFSFTGYLLESESPYVTARGITPTGYFWRTYPVLALFVLIGALRLDYERPYARPWAMAVGFVTGLVIVMVFAYGLLPWIWSRISSHLHAPLDKVAKPDAGNMPLHGYALIVFGALAVLYLVLAIAMPVALPTATAVGILIGMVVLTYGAMRFALPRLRFVVFLAVMLLTGVVHVLTPYKHRYPKYGEAAYENPVTIPEDGGGVGGDGLIPDNAAFDAWVKCATYEGAKPKLVLVATSGGGIRAAVWTGAVLNALSERIPRFSRHVRMMSGSSGGMVGAAFWVASLREDADAIGQFSQMAADSLEPVTRSMALRDVPTFFLPGTYPDRGVALEDSWAANAPLLQTKFGELAAGERAGWRPSLVFTPVFVEDGRRAIVSNLDLSAMTVNRGPEPGQDSVIYSRPAIELLRILPSTRELPLASISRMNASFPFLTTAAELPVRPRRHIVDAGYWDNYGVSVSAAWLANHFDDVVQKTSGVVLIQIRDLVEQPAFLKADQPREPGLALTGYSGILAPFIAAYEARSSVMVLRNDSDVQQLARAFRGATRDAQFFTTVIIENPNTSALTWSMTEREAKELLQCFDGNTCGVQSAQIAALRKWWDRTPVAIAQPSIEPALILP